MVDNIDNWTIQKLLNWVNGYLSDKGVDAPRLSAELLLCQVLGCGRIELYTNFDRPVAQDKLATLRELVKRAGTHEPIGYLAGRTEFYSLSIKVTPDCLIPRPETELLVERAIEFLRSRRPVPAVLDVLDLCTGSGCIAVAVAKNYPNAKVIATDICDAALAVAAVNVDAHGLGERVHLFCGDLFDPIIEGLGASRFDLVVCNPPYVSTAEMRTLDKNVRDYEPVRALHAGADGLDVYRRIAEAVGEFLKDGAALILEIGRTQGAAVCDLLRKTAQFAEIKIEKDHQNNDRIVTARK